MQVTGKLPNRGYKFGGQSLTDHRDRRPVIIINKDVQSLRDGLKKIDYYA